MFIEFVILVWFKDYCQNTNQWPSFFWIGLGLFGIEALKKALKERNGYH